MSQINLHSSPEFTKSLSEWMRLRGFRSKAQAIRAAVEEGLERAKRRAIPLQYSTWIGLAGKPDEAGRQFSSDADLWS